MKEMDKNRTEKQDWLWNMITEITITWIPHWLHGVSDVYEK